MAARKDYLYFGGAETISPMITSGTQFEFDETEVWNYDNEVASSDQTKRSMHKSRPLKKPLKKNSSNVNQRPIAGTSLPVNVPDWSRILGNEYSGNHRKENQEDEYEDDEDEYGRLPPHEYLARTRGSSFSVHEGIGRTLKG